MNKTTTGRKNKIMITSSKRKQLETHVKKNIIYQNIDGSLSTA